MNIENAAKARFVEKILQEEAVQIKNLQMKAVESSDIDNISGALRNCLSGGFVVSTQSTGPQVTLKYVKHLRFIDIRSQRGRIYTRVIWGRVYNDTRKKIAYGYSQNIRKALIKEVTESMQSIN